MRRKWRAIETAVLLMQHEPRTSSEEHRFRHEFQAFLPHLDAFSGPFDLRVRTCRQLCRSTVLTHLKTKSINITLRLVCVIITTKRKVHAWTSSSAR